MSIVEAMVEHFQNGEVTVGLALLAECPGEERDAANELLLEGLEHFDGQDWESIGHRLAIAEALLEAGAEDDRPYEMRMDALRKRGAFSKALEFGQAHLDRLGVLIATYELASLEQPELTTKLLPRLYAREDADAAAGDRLWQLGYQLHSRSSAASSLEPALLLYRGAIACGAGLPRSVNNAALAALTLGYAAQAMVLARQGLGLDPTHQSLVATLLDAAVQADDHDELAKALERAHAMLDSAADEDGLDLEDNDTIALLSDTIDAELTIDPARAVDTARSYVRDEGEMGMRVRTSFARALARAGEVDAARRMLRTGIGQGDAGKWQVHRARAELAWAAGKRDRAQGSMCAALLFADNPTPLLADPAFEAVEADYDPKSDTPIRPVGVPPEASWVDDPVMGREWVAGSTDANGLKQGVFRWYRADGTLCCENNYLDGKPEGPYRRFHENGEVSNEGTFKDGKLHGTRRWIASDETTSELMHTNLAPSIRTSEMDYLRDQVVAIRHFDGDGNRVLPDGQPSPPRPEGVPENAGIGQDQQHWVEGATAVDDSLNNNPRRVGLWRWWSLDGMLVKTEPYRDGELHGEVKRWSEAGELLFEGRYEGGEGRGELTYYRGEDEEDDDFPTAGANVAKATRLDGSHLWRYFNEAGIETTIDATPLDAIAGKHPGLPGFFQELEAIDWTQLEDAGGTAEFVPAIVRDLLAEDEDEEESISNAVFGDLWWHLCHQGTIYSATGAAIPFLIRLCNYDGFAHRPSLLNFLSAACSVPRATLAQARAERDDDRWADVLAVQHAWQQHGPELIGLLGHPKPAVRALTARLCGFMFDYASQITAALLERYAAEDEPPVQASILFSLTNLAEDEALQTALDALERPGFVGIAAALALVFGGEHRGPAGRRLLAGFADARTDACSSAWGNCPWADEELVLEMGRAVNAAGFKQESAARLVERFGEVETAAQLGIVWGAIWLAMPDEASDELDPVLAEVFRAIADDDALWRFEELGAMLERFEFPGDRHELREFAAIG